MTGFEIESHSNAVKSDGSVIIGASERQGWRWTEPTGSGQSRIASRIRRAVNLEPYWTLSRWRTDRRITRAANRPDEVAIIWDQLHGVRNLQRVLEVEYGLALAGWTLKSASTVSDDGMVIVGNGLNPFGQTEAWLINLSIPRTNHSPSSNYGIAQLLDGSSQVT